MLNLQNIFDTIDMIDKQHLDIRTITMGISLLDCVSEDAGRCCDKIYDKICRRAEKLVRTGEDIESEFGIPIVNKRISVTPMALVAGGCDIGDYVPFALTLDRAAHTCGVNFIGGYSALVQKGFAKGDELLLRSIPQALAQTELVCSSVNVGSTKAGINMDAVARMGRIIKETAHLTRAQDGLGCAKLVVFCNAVEDNPFMAGAFHGVGEADSVINVGVSGPGVVYHALQSCKGQPFDVVAETIKKTAFQITRMGQMVAAEASKRLETPFGIVDLSLAPTPAVGDSVARILEEMGLEVCGTHGTTAALALLNDAVKKGGVMASSHVGGLSGAFIPVSEDEGMIAAASSGALTLDKLEKEQKFTQPPARYSEASLVRELEELGIGRPSTYASIISTLQDRDYVTLEEKHFAPTDLGRVVCDRLREHFKTLMDVGFTAHMEELLDKVAEGQQDWVALLRNFNNDFDPTLLEAAKSMGKAKTDTVTDIPCPECGKPLAVKFGKTGQFLACTGYPACRYTSNYTRDEQGQIHLQEKVKPEFEKVGTCPECGKDLVLKRSRTGSRFIACSGYPDCKHAEPYSTGVPCPREGCNGVLVEKSSKRGKIFYSCSNYPQCDYALWDWPIAEPCPECGSPLLVLKNTKAKGKFIACPEKTCKYTRPLEGGSEDDAE